MKSSPDTRNDAVLEANVDSLLGKSYDPPRLEDTTRARIRQRLIARHAAPRAAAAPLYAIGLGLAAAAGVAVIAGALLGHDAPGTGAATRHGQELALADGTTVLLDHGATVDVVGARHVRVTGAALLDVTPGKGTFTVDTDHGTLAVLGTRFVVDAQSTRTVTAVIRGAVRLETKDGKVILHAGEQGIARPGEPPTRGPAPRLSHLASWARTARQHHDGDDVQPARNGTLFARETGLRPGQSESNQEYPLPLAQLTVDAVIDHQVARVALDQTFENPQPRELEGVYRFAIPSDAALQRFAMYVDGTLTESAVVERMRARRIYEELVYHRIDPGLLEWAGAGRLSMRVYPLRAQSDKRIVLAYTQSLPRLYDDWTMTVPLPEVDGTVDDVKFNVRVKGCAQCELHSPSHKVEVGHDGDDAIVTYHATADKIGDSLVLVARDARTQTQVATHDADGSRYLSVRARPELGAAPGAHRSRTWVIVDDVSASRGPLERRAQADIVTRLLRELDEDDRVTVLTADAIVRELDGGLTRVDDVDPKPVHAFLTSDDVGGVGATDLGKAFDRATAILTGVDPRDAFVLYLGDGVVTGGERGLTALRDKLRGKATFVGVGVGDGVDTPTLSALADATGGSVYSIDLADDLAWHAFDLVASLYTARVTGVTASLVDAQGKAIAGETYLRAGQLGDGEELDLVARVPATAAVVAVELTGQRDGAPWRSRIAVTTDTSGVNLGPIAAPVQSDGAYLPRMWAQRHVAALMLAKEDAVIAPPCSAQPCASEDQLRIAHREDIRKQVVELGKKYFLLSRHTSLLVLENDKMYADYGVTKGSGDTWAPYSVPAKVAVKHVPLVASGVAGVDPDATLVRSPIPAFYDYQAVYKQQMELQGQFATNRGWAAPSGRITVATRGFGSGTGRGFGPDLLSDARRERESFKDASQPMDTLDGIAAGEAGGTGTSMALEEKADKAKRFDDADDGEEGDLRWAAQKASEHSSDGPAVVSTSQLEARSQMWMVGGATTKGGGRKSNDRRLHAGYFGYGNQPPYPIAFNYPNDNRLDDLTEFVPAMFASPVDAAEDELVAAGDGGTGSVDAAARALIGRARKALPEGTYTLGDGPSIAVTRGGLAWRTVDADGLEELTRFDGTTWRRAYPELGLEVVRDLGTRAPAVLFSYLPLVVADADQLAAWFAVTTRGAHTLVLAPAATPKQPLFTIELDDHDRVIAIKTARGTDQLTVTWGVQGPTAATVGGAKTTIGFTPALESIAIPTGLVGVTLPLAQPARARDAVAAAAVGTDAWRAAQRQAMATAAAVGDAAGQWQAYAALLDHGGVAPGDLVLAGRGVALQGDKDFARALAAFGADVMARPAPARYMAAARAYGKNPKPDGLAAATDAGLVGTLWRYRDVLAKIAGNKRDAAIAGLQAMGDRAPELRMIAAASIGQRYDWPASIKAKAWDAVATGDMRNVARYEAGRAFYNSGDYPAAAERYAALLADIDLTAAPVPVDYYLQGAMQASPRGQAGFEMAWRGFVDRVIVDGGYDHVVALATSASQLNRPFDTDRAIGRAAELAGDDRAMLIDVLELSLSLGQTDRATALLPALVTGDPDPTVERLAMQLAIGQGRTADAADHLERAMAAEPGPSPLAAVRADYAALISLRGRVAQLALGPARDGAIQSVLATSRKWREIDPANGTIDSVVGELMLDLDRPEEAWRQLSTAIERDPLDGAGWIRVADALERHGRYDQALATWQEALVIDQTNPGPRLRKAQLLYAMGRTGEADAIIKDAVTHRWHDRFTNDAYQLRSLAQQRKLLPTAKPGPTRGR